MNHSHSNAFITIIVYYNKDRKIDFQQRSKNMLLIDMVRHWLNLDKTYQHKKDQAEYKSFQMFDLFNHICRSPKLFSLNVHIWNSRNCLSYIRMLAHHFEWLLENLLVTMKESALCTAQKKYLQTHSSQLGRKTLSKHSLDMDDHFFICSSKAPFDKTISFSSGSEDLENKVHLALFISVFLWSLPKYWS